MSDCASAAIVIGGTLAATAYSELVAIIDAERLSTDYGGEPFEEHHREPGYSLRLCASEVRWGYFDQLESWCVQHGLPFVRWSGGCPGSFDPERFVFTGAGEPVSYSVTEDDVVMIDRATVEKLSDPAAILAHFDAAEFVVPPLAVEGDPDRAAEA